MELSQRVQMIKPSATIAVSNKAMELQRQGKDIISLAAGEPDFDTPEHIKAAAKKAIDAGKTKYPPVDGTPELKKAIITKFKRDNQLDYAANELLVSDGAKHSIFNAFAALLNPGDEVLIPVPAWVSYPDMAVMFGAKPVLIETSMADGLKLTAAKLEQHITPKTKCLMINSPCNPTGVIYSEADLKPLAEVLKKHPHVVLITDDIYEHIRWTSEPFKNLLNVAPELRDRTIIINGVSKAYAMTGWRIGIAAGPQDIINAMKKIQSQSTSGACSISQAAATEAFGGDQSCLKPMVQAYRERSELVFDRFSKIPGFNCLRGDGAFYAFADITELLSGSAFKDDIAFATHLLEHAGVALVPGTAFMAPGFIRLSFAASVEMLDAALTRIEKAVSEIA